MERLLKSPGGRREEQRYPLQTRPSRVSAVSVSAGLATARSRANGALRGGYGAPPKTGDIYDFPHQLSGEMPLRVTNEKELLQGLNERFAAFIEKVRHLESQNSALEKEIGAIRLRAKSSASLSKEYEPEMKELREQVREVTVQKHQVELSLQSLQDELDALREKCEQEARDRADAEESVRVLKRFVSDARLAQQEMDRKARALADEIGFLKKNHEAEVAEIATQIQEGQARQEVSGFGRGELTTALRDIRLQLEGHAAVCDIQPADERFRVHVAQLTRAAEINRDTLMATKAEISDYRRQLQSKSVELDSVKGMREAMDRQLYDLEQRHKAELHHYQDAIRELELELKNTRYDMSSHVQEYQDLLNVKMALDAEIYSYRKLLEGEESRYSILSDAHVSVPYVYRQSPIYTLPCVKRQGGAPRKAEPQYKFVEEIITETTREDVEISDTGSEDGSGAGEGDKPEKVCSEDEDAAKAAESDGPTQENDTQASAPEDEKESPKLEEEENEEEQTKEEDESPNMSLCDSVTSTEVDMGSELKQGEAPTPEFTEVKAEDEDETRHAPLDSKAQEAVIETKSDKPQADITSDKKVPLDTEEQEQQTEKEIDKDSKKQPEPAEQKATHEAVTEPEEKLNPDSHPLKDPETKEKVKEEISQKPEDKKVTEKIELVAKPQNVTAAKIPEKEIETSEVKSVEVEVSTADPQPASQKAEVRHETAPEDSKAQSKDRVETSKVDVPDTQKAENIKDLDVEEVQKDLEATKHTEGAKKEASPKNEEKKIFYDQQAEKKVESKPAGDPVTVKAEKVGSAKSSEGEKQDDVSKSAANEIEIEMTERKESATKDVIGSTKIDEEESVKSKAAEKVLDQMQSKQEQPKVVAVETKSEEQPQKNATKEHVVDSAKTEEKATSDSTEKELEAIQKDEPSKPAEKEAKSEAQTEKTETKDSKLETSKEAKEVDIIKPKGQETDRTSKDGELEQSVPKTLAEKEQSQDQTEMVKDMQDAKATKTETIDKTGTGALQEIPKVDSTKTESPAKATAAIKPDQSMEPALKMSAKKEQDKEQKTVITDVNKDPEQTKDREVPKVAENGVPT